MLVSSFLTSWIEKRSYTARTGKMDQYSKHFRMLISSSKILWNYFVTLNIYKITAFCLDVMAGLFHRAR